VGRQIFGPNHPVRYLLDTHAVFWWLFFPGRLSIGVREAISTSADQCFVSAISAYEMSCKHHRGRWPEVAMLVAAFEEICRSEGFTVLPLSASHAARAGAFPVEHRDPFDRMIAAQALVEGLTVVSADGEMEGLGVERVW
jgi:PIN domain nuclease of toxin-antitoxin system